MDEQMVERNGVWEYGGIGRNLSPIAHVT